MAGAPSPTKDCRSCHTRRIRCDRTVPRCVKCKRKGIPCPGYGVQLRWTNSIASRGRFKGLGAPANNDAVQEDKRSPATVQPSTSSSTWTYNAPADLSTSQYHRAPQISASQDSKFEQVPQSTLDELVQYYAQEIAPFNVWVHSEFNGYARFVIPLATSQPVLKLAIMGIAAAHQPRPSIDDPDFAQWACQKALVLITDRVRKLAGMSTEETRAHIDTEADSSEAVLAATLVLSNYSLLESDISLALFHLQAARVLIWTLSANRESGDNLFAFLKNQVAGLDIVACTTLFDAKYIRDAVLPDPARGVFGHFLGIIHRITIQSIEEADGSCKVHLSTAELEDEFELARGASLMAAGHLIAESNASYRRDVTRLIQSFHHAGMLYACKRVRVLDSEHVEKQHTDRLFRLLGQFEDMNACMGNLSWPVFIGGLCTRRDESKNQAVRDICTRLSTSSPYKYYANILTFLEEVWASDHQDWAVTARQWEDKSMPILAV